MIKLLLGAAEKLETGFTLCFKVLLLIILVCLAAFLSVVIPLFIVYLACQVYFSIYLILSATLGYVVSFIPTVEFRSATIFFFGLCIIRHLILLVKNMIEFFKEAHNEYHLSGWFGVLSNFFGILLVPDLANPKKFRMPF